MAENRADFTVRGIDSDDDVRAIEEELADLNGVMETEIDDGGEARVRYDHDVLSEERIRRTVRDLGYDVEYETE